MIDLKSNNVWSEADILAHGRAVIASQVPEARQDELRTIMLGHIAGMRTATAEELAEIGVVQAATEAQSAANDKARADNALLAGVIALEAAHARLALPEVTEPLTVQVDADGELVDAPNPAIAQDAAEREAAAGVVEGAGDDVLALYLLRNPLPEIVEPTPKAE